METCRKCKINQSADNFSLKSKGWCRKCKNESAKRIRR